MKRFLILIILLFPFVSCVEKEDNKGKTAPVEETFDMHPYLLLGKGGENNIKALIESNTKMMTIHRKVLQQANDALKKGPTQYVLSGGYLLETSRAALQKIFSLAYGWRMTERQEYLDAVEAELVSVCSFPKWDMTSYLGTAEMAMAVAIGYDWCFHDIKESTRQLVEKALTKYALDTGLSSAGYNQFRNSGGNWNQVCSAGLMFAAIALKDVEPTKSESMMNLCRSSIKYAVDAYDPDGAYKEGPMYWGYGTEFQVMYNTAVSKLGEEPYLGNTGFKKTPYFYLNAVGPFTKAFNYGDAGSTVTIDIAQYYFAGLLKDNSLLWWNNKVSTATMADHRLLPAALILAKDYSLGTGIPHPKELTWTGAGATPVYFARSEWGSTSASYFGVKGGQANISHQHMDAGSFIFDAKGVRWAQDFGNENYNNMEAYLGYSNFWNMAQNSPRWTLTAYNNRAHNVMTINDRDFNVAGKATINSTIDEGGKVGAKLNLTPLYYDMTLVTRQICLVGEKLEIIDYVEPKKASKVRWTMNTDKNMTVKIISDNEILLSNSAGHRLSMRFSAKNASLKASRWDITPGSNQAHTGIGVGFDANVAANAKAEFAILLSPEN